MSETAPVGQAACASRTSRMSETVDGLRRTYTRPSSRAKTDGAVSTQTVQRMHFVSIVQRYVIVVPPGSRSR